jgi:hypothetical protein
MYGLSHKNVLSILGVSIEDHTAPFLIYPHRGDSNLKRQVNMLTAFCSGQSSAIAGVADIVGIVTFV